MPSEAAAPGQRAYGRLFAAYGVGLFGTGVATTALALFAFDLEGEDAGVIIGTALATKVACLVLVAPIAAALTGRLPKRSLLLALDLLSAGALLLLPFVTALWQLFALVLVFSASQAAYTPTYQALVPALLPDQEDYAWALAKSRALNEIETVASPLIAAGLLLALDVRGLFGATMAAFLVAALLVVRLRLPPVPPMPRTTLWHRIALGPRLLLGDRRLRPLLPLSLCSAAAVAMVLVNTVVVVQGEFDLGPRATAVALASFGLGSVTGALTVPRVLDRLTGRTVVVLGTAVVALGLLVIPWIGRFGPLLALWAAIGFGSSLVLLPGPMLLRQVVRAPEHPLAYSALYSVANASLLVTYLCAGWIGQLSISAAAIALALVAMIGGFAAAAGWPSARVAGR